MQTIYAVENTSPAIDQAQALKILEKHLEQSRQLFTYLVHFLTEVARYAETDSRLRASKHLPSQEDLNVNTAASAGVAAGSATGGVAAAVAVAAAAAAAPQAISTPVSTPRVRREKRRASVIQAAGHMQSL